MNVDETPEQVSPGPISPEPISEVEVAAAPIAPPKKTVKPKPKRPTGLLVAIFVVFLIAAFGIIPRIGRSQKLSGEVNALKTEVPAVAVVRLQPKGESSPINLPSSLQAVTETNINARLSGYVQSRYADIGSRVKQGQLLAVIESPEVDQQVSEAQAQVLRSQAGLGQAQADEGRLTAAVSAAASDESKSQAGLLQADADLIHFKAAELRSKSAVLVARANQAAAAKTYDSDAAGVRRAQAGLDIATKTLGRWKELFKSGAVAGQDVDERQADFDSNQAQVEAAQAVLSSAKAQMQAATESIGSAQADVAAAAADTQSAFERVKAARAAVDSAHSNVNAAKENRLASRSSITAAGASIASDQANERRTRALQSYENIVAPFSGVITARNFEVGDLVNPTSGGTGATDPMSTVTKTGLFGLARTDELVAQVNVPESDVADIRRGQSADVVTEELPKQVFKGTVNHVSGALDAASRTLLVEVRVPNAEGLLKPGMYAQIRFESTSGAMTLRIPAPALIFDARGTRVAIVRSDDTIHFVPVTVGKDYGDTIEIQNGLQGNETLVANPDATLTEGAKVQPTEVAP